MSRYSTPGADPDYFGLVRIHLKPTSGHPVYDSNASFQLGDGIDYNTVQYNIRLLGLDRTQAHNSLSLKLCKIGQLSIIRMPHVVTHLSRYVHEFSCVQYKKSIISC